ncbi:HAL/PAL/TAL family ammonia-lyase [Neolewinella agarilytica]|uniref:Histidine ammonia-lyase n=1 Tax=Neolewinella agarilytica TaxID=478744 RepID=A0A1H9AKL4_9BACT|nr:aromatic amino acid ammonia-lyase [Neolewinella agarilytica]SEP77051.1 histidine ammonia-lyase [Neolewinella agarilytica]
MSKPNKKITSKSRQTCWIGADRLTIEDLEKVIYGKSKVGISSATWKELNAGHEFLKKFSQDKVIYGVNTGFGPMAPYKIPDDKHLELQLNLIRSHCSGSGKLVSKEQTIALMIARLSSLAKGYSGIHPEWAELLTQMINEEITPHIYEHGGLGASGDLVQLAHLALCIIGEGKVKDNGEDRPAKEVFTEKNWTPLRPRIREALATLNGTSAMTGYGAINVIKARRLVEWSELSSALLIEIVGSYDDYYSEGLNGVKAHAGQQKAARRLRELLTGSKRLRDRSDHLYCSHENKKLDDKVQEYYSIRCLPQIMGPILDTLIDSQQTVEDELNSVSDNPIIDYQNENVFHGGNFHGDYVSLSMDKLKIAITKLSLLIERQLNYLLNDKLNQQLPPFVNMGTLGLNLGMQGAQFVATSTTSENQSLCSPVYIHTIPSNNDNQDIVSMGANAALMANRVIENTYEVLAVKLLTAIQAVDVLGIQESLAPKTRKLYDLVRSRVPAFSQDGIMYEATHPVLDLLNNTDPQTITGEEKASKSNNK